MISKRQAFLWILLLTFLFVGARNFEEGMYVDSPVYAIRARNIARTGEWFLLDSNVPDLKGFADHPHLVFWLTAIVFKLLPIADWTARIPGHISFFLTLLTLFFLLQKKVNEKVAVATCLLMASTTKLTHFFSSCYLDPELLLFGTLSLFCLTYPEDTSQKKWPILGGVSLSLAILSKGMAAAGFLPVLGLCALRWGIGGVILYGLGAAPCLLAYYLAVTHSNAPDYLQGYWANQMTHRFESMWDIRKIFGREFWSTLLIDTHFLAPLGLFSIPNWKKHHTWIPLMLFATFAFLAAPISRLGLQYNLMLLPWVAWAIADGVFSRIPWTPLKVARATGCLAVAGVFLLQYVPTRIHSGKPLSLYGYVREIAKNEHYQELVFHSKGEGFIDAGPVAWYADIPILYSFDSERLEPKEGRLYLVRPFDNDERAKALLEHGWCLRVQTKDGFLFSPPRGGRCPT